MNTFFRSFIIFLLFLAGLSTVLYGQSIQTPVQVTLQTAHGDIKAPAPSAIPLLNPEDANKSNKEAIFAYEKKMQEEEDTRNKDIAYVISSRRKHCIYKNIELILLLFIHLSFLGYCNFIRKRFKLHWSDAVMLEACALAVLMMVMGFLHIMKQLSYVICFCGLFLLFVQLFRKNYRWGFPSWNLIKQLVLRSEYIFIVCAITGLFMWLLHFKVELCSASDNWNAWLNNFFYIILNDRWPDAYYKNYASAYAMIINGISYYFANILHDSGTQMYLFGYCWFNTMVLMPLFRRIKWHNIPLFEMLLFVFCLLCYRFNMRSVYNNIILAASVLLVLAHILSSKKKKEFFRNTFIMLLVAILSMYVYFLPVNVLVYVPDTTLGCATIGLFFSIAWFLIYNNRRFNRNAFLYLLPLGVLSLIKPTGVIPALLISICFVLSIIFHAIRKKLFLKGKINNWKSISYLFGLLIVMLSPIIFNNLWMYYAKCNNMIYQHNISPKELVRQAKDQIRNGVEDNKKIEWHEKIAKMSIGPYRIDKKSIIEKHLDDIFRKFSILDVDHSFSSLNKDQWHVLTVSTILFLFALVCLFFIDKRLIYLYLLLFVFVFYLVYIFNQYYLAPMFTDVPGLFRYFYPAYSLVLGISFLGVIFLLDNKRSIFGYIIGLLLIVFFFRHFFSPIAFSFVFNETHSSVGYTMLANNNAKNNKVLYCAFSRYAQIYDLLIRSGLIKKNYGIILPPDSIDESYLVPVDPTFVFSGRIVNRFIVPTDSNQTVVHHGLYIASPRMIIHDKSENAQQRVRLSEFFYNHDAISLLNEVYYLSDLNTWRMPPWVERKLSDQPDRNWKVPKDNNTVFENKKTVNITKNEKEVILLNDCFNYIFSQDYIRFEGIYSTGVLFSVFLDIYERNMDNITFRWLKRCDMSLRKIPADKDNKYNKFCADLDLSSIQTDNLNLYFKVGIRLEPKMEGKMHDFHLYQFVSGILNINGALLE